LTDIDPFVMAVVNGHLEKPKTVLAAAILLAAGSNGIMKGIYVAVLGSQATRRIAPGVLLLTAVCTLGVAFGLLPKSRVPLHRFGWLALWSQDCPSRLGPDNPQGPSAASLACCHRGLALLAHRPLTCRGRRARPGSRRLRSVPRPSHRLLHPH